MRIVFATYPSFTFGLLFGAFGYKCFGCAEDHQIVGLFFSLGWIMIGPAGKDSHD